MVTFYGIVHLLKQNQIQVPVNFDNYRILGLVELLDTGRDAISIEKFILRRRLLCPFEQIEADCFRHL